MFSPVKTGVTHLRLNHFRSYAFMDLALETTFEPVVLTGRNGAGKTNVLEAVSFLAPGRGLRSVRMADVARRCEMDRTLGGNVLTLPVRWSVSAHVRTAAGAVQIGTGTTGDSDRRQVKIDGKNARQADLGAVLRCLWLTPAQDKLFCGDPMARRRFLDRLVGAFDPNHADRLTEYNNAFRQWSCLLRDGRFDAAWLDALETQMVMNGVAVSASRTDVVARISDNLRRGTDKAFPTAEIILTGALEKALAAQPATAVEDMFCAQLKHARKSYAEGGSLAGPHTADFQVMHRQKDMDASLCSTGEQKALLLSVILAEMKTMTDEQGVCPLLLLDEVAAHLDVHRRNALFDILAQQPTQVWMSGTDAESFAHLAGRAAFYDVADSTLERKVA
ncbi:MAG: DNA replication/repair protein RecF [Alphaproteobacteria bacterium]|nr:DNA replication/repair protein RecF [Alphaproteobacteria bacterium]